MKKIVTFEILQSLGRGDSYSRVCFFSIHTSLVLLLHTKYGLEEFISCHFNSGYDNDIHA